MAADLHVQILPFDTIEQNEEVLRAFTSNVIDSRFFNPQLVSYNDPIPDTRYKKEDVYDLLIDQGDAWIGQVSWLKAALFEDGSYIPPVVEQVAELVPADEATLITDELIQRLCDTIDNQPPNTTQYEVLTDSTKLRELLTRNKGRFIFSISW